MQFPMERKNVQLWCKLAFHHQCNVFLELSFHLYPDYLHLATLHFSHSPDWRWLPKTYSSFTKSQRHHIHNSLCSYLGPEGQRVLGKMVWTSSVHTAIDIKKGSVINVVCYESGLLWTGLVWMGRYERGLFWMVCYEWSVMNGSVLNGDHFEAWLCFYESRVSNCLL